MKKTHYYFFIISVISMLSIFSVLNAGAADDKKPIPTTDALEKTAQKSLVAYLEKTLPDFQAPTPLAFATTGIHEPRTALELFHKAVESKERNGEDYMVTSGLVLSRVLKGEHLQRLIGILKESGHVDLQYLAAEILFPLAPDEAIDIVKKTQAPPDEKYLTSLLFVASVKARQIKNWGKAQVVIPTRPKETESKNPIRDIAFEMTQIHINESIDGLKKLLIDPRFPNRMALQGMLQGFLDGMTVRDNESKTSETYARFYLRAARNADKYSAFVLASYAAYMYGFKPPKEVIEVIKNNWSEDILNKDFGIEYAAAFYAMKTLISEDTPFALKIGHAICKYLFAKEDSKSYYHAVSAVASVVVVKDPVAAVEIANRIMSLEWHVHAMRVIFRKWAEAQPEYALKVEKKREDFGEMAEQIAWDVTLEAVVGASKTRPDLALTALSSLPDTKSRFYDGICLIAPAVAKKDKRKALEILKIDGNKGIEPRVAMSLSWILLDDRAKDIVVRYTPFFPDWASPADFWPGPTLSLPLRF